MFQNSRWRNYGLWVAILSWILTVFFMTGVITAPEQYEQIEKVAIAFLNILVFAGILSNPVTDNKGFMDDK